MGMNRPVNRNVFAFNIDALTDFTLTLKIFYTAVFIKTITRFLILFLISTSFFSDLTRPTTTQPYETNSLTKALLIPEEAPVTRTIFFLCTGFDSLG